MLSQTTFEQFTSAIVEAKAAGKKVVAVLRGILGDFITPTMAYEAVSKIWGQEGSAILESALTGKHSGRYSIVCCNPYMRFESTGTEVINQWLYKTPHTIGCAAHPLKRIQELLKQYSPLNNEGYGFFFGGAVGYIGHEAISLLEPTVTTHNTDGLGLPDILMNFYRFILVFDRTNGSLFLVNNLPFSYDFEAGHSLGTMYDNTLEEIKKLESVLASYKIRDISLPVAWKLSVTSNLSQGDFESMVCKAKERIAAGDVFQVVLSQRFETPFPSIYSLDFYRVLMQENPSPYLFHLGFGQRNGFPFCLVGASPEVMVRIQNRKMLIRALAGTRRRGANEAEDAAQAQKLANDPKDQAEHRMLVDLPRNDVGRFAEPGSVKVEGLMRVENYGAVMHMVTDITGTLRSDVSSFEAMLGCLPAGTLSGAPKIRALQLISELEPCQRGPYGGAVGWFTDTDLDTCIMIRSAVITGNKLYWQTGAGIVADSVPASEYQETLAKSISIRRVLVQMAGEQ